MLTLCFTPVAVAAFRRTRKSKKTTRGDAVVRTARLGLVSLIVVALAGAAQAGGFGGSHSLGSTGGSGMSMARSNSNGPTFTGNQLNTQSLKLNTQTNFNPQTLSTIGNTGISRVTKVDTKIGGLNNLGNKTDRILSDRGVIDVLKNKNNNPIIDKNIPKLVDKIKLDNKKPLIDKKIPGLADSIKEKCKDHDKCHDKCCPHFCWYPPCPWWYCWNYPVWCPLYTCSCGYWYDVPVVVVEEGVDLQLLAVRMLDAGDAEQGPAFRVWVRNNSRVAISHPFNVLVLAARDANPAQDLPQAGARISAINAGQVLPIDIRLPVAANQPGLPMLHVLVDSHREINEVNEANNGTVLARSEVLPLEVLETAQAVTAGPAGAANVAPQGPTQPATADAASSDSTDSDVPLMLRGPVSN